jgi:pilus assembly protein FimV
VLKFFVKAIGLVAALVLSNAVFAVGMGGINVTSALGEPLKAEIELVAVGKADKNNIYARLASPEVFKVAGLEYPATLPKLNFQIDVRANGDSYVKLTSTQPVSEPFVSLLVELTWPSGKLLREYTFLLDPPGFKPEQPKPAEIKPLEPKVISSTESQAKEPIESGIKQESVAASPDEVKGAKLATREAARAEKSAESSNSASGTIEVKSGDTLGSIAIETKSPDVSLEQMLVAMYRTNKDAFDGNNMNRLKTGKILRVPDSNDVGKVVQAEAVKEISAQVVDWNIYRQKLAAASTTAVSEHAPKQESSGKIGTKVAEKTPPAKESQKEVVRLSKGEAPGDKAASGGKEKALQDKLHAMEEEATAKSKTLKDSTERIAMLEKNIKEMQRLVELKGQLAAAALSKTEKAEVKPVIKPEVKPEVKPENKPEPKPEAVSAVVKAVPTANLPASAVKPVKPITSKEEAPTASLLDDILAEPLYLAGGAGALLGLGGLGFMLARRRKTVAANDSEASDIGTRISAPVAPSPDTGDFTQTLIVAPTLGQNEQDDVDPISEADLFLNFGRDKQAIEILKDALKNNANNQQVRLKLLSIYSGRKDAKSFAEEAVHVQDSGDAAAWGQAAAMGRRLDPGNALYGDESAESASVVLPEETNIAQVAPSLDFDLGLGAAEESSVALDVPLDVTTVTPIASLDFDLGFDMQADEQPAAIAPESTIAQPEVLAENADISSALDFDLGFEIPVEAESPAQIDTESTLVLDSPLVQNAEVPESSPSEQAAAVDFDITAQAETPLPHAEEFLHNVEESLPFDGGLDFDVTAVQSTPSAKADELGLGMQEIPEQVAEVSVPVAVEPDPVVEAAAEPEEMEFSLDFPTTETHFGAETAVASAPDVAKEVGAVDLSEINLNLDAPVTAPPEEIKDARWHEVATKLDLARAYQEMGDAPGAREILEEVLAEGDDAQRAAAEVMVQQLSA